jgi:hypothetical protein
MSVSIDALVREGHPNLEQLERERDVLEVQRRLYDTTGILQRFHASAEDLAALRVREWILGLRRAR